MLWEGKLGFFVVQRARKWVIGLHVSLKEVEMDLLGQLLNVLGREVSGYFCVEFSGWIVRGWIGRVCWFIHV